ncbi:amino acid permease [Nonomuraea rubra]|uniref:amino acid permease n=1 Tax=Nonomuraea rubra TaxID=46180 RepID=UPI0031E7A031
MTTEEDSRRLPSSAPQAGAGTHLERILELRHLLLDHLHPRGCFTTFGQAWNNGGPIAISWGWPLISLFILIIGFCMSELVSAYRRGRHLLVGRQAGQADPRLAHRLAQPHRPHRRHASVDYGCATFLNITLNRLTGGAWEGTLPQAFLLFVIILALHALINIYSHKLISLLQNVSVWWHVAGAAIVVAILIFAPESHQSADFVFFGTNNNSGFGDGSDGLPFWLYVLPLGFLLTQYTITGFDACAHVSEETQGAARSAARGLWQSIFYSAIGAGSCCCRSCSPPRTWTSSTTRRGSSAPSSRPRCPPRSPTASRDLHDRPVLLRDELRDLDVRMTFAFSRDGAVPAGACGRRWTAHRTPSTRSSPGCVAAALITLPALYAPPGLTTAGRLLRRRVHRRHRALPGILIPIWLRLRMATLPARPVDARQEVQGAVLDRLRRDRDRLDLLHPCRSRRPACPATPTSPGRRSTTRRSPSGWC